MRKKESLEVSPAVKKALDKGGMVVSKEIFAEVVNKAEIPMIDVTKDNATQPEVAKCSCTDPLPVQRFELIATNANAASERVGTRLMLHAVETYKSLVFVSISGFFALLLANLTGAIASLLMYRGQVASLWFAAGVILSIVCFFLSYQVQFSVYQEDMQKWKQGKHMDWVKVTATVAALSLLCFIAGAVAVVQ